MRARFGGGAAGSARAKLQLDAGGDGGARELTDELTDAREELRADAFEMEWARA